MRLSSHPPIDVSTYKAHDADPSSQASSNPPMVGLRVSIMDEPVSSEVTAVFAEDVSGQETLQSAVPPTFAAVGNRSICLYLRWRDCRH